MLREMMRRSSQAVGAALIAVAIGGAPALAQEYPVPPNATIPTPPANGTTIGIVQHCVNSAGQAVPMTSGQCAGFLPMGPRTPLPFCPLSSLATAINLSGCAAMAQSPTYAVICAYGQSVVWRDDGTPPTATPGTGGQALNANNCMGYTAVLANFQVIQQAASAVLGVSFYK